MSRELIEAAEGVRARLLLWRTLAAQSRERREETIELAIPELWEAKDQAALDALDAVLNKSKGLQPLPFTMEVTQ